MVHSHLSSIRTVITLVLFSLASGAKVSLDGKNDAAEDAKIASLWQQASSLLTSGVGMMRKERSGSVEIKADAAFKPVEASPPGELTQRSGGEETLTVSNHPLVAHWHLENCENNANTFTKTSGKGEYDAEALTEHGNVMSIKVRAGQTDKAFRVGLTANEFDHADFEHGFFLGFYDRGRLYVPDWTVSGYTKNDEFALKVENAQMTLWKNDAKIHTFAGSITGPMYAAVYMHDVGAKAQITEMAVTANLGNGGDETVVLANQGPNGPVGENGPPGPPGVVGMHGDPGPPATLEMLYSPAPAGGPGPRGSSGPVGDDGPRGPPGPMGKKGAVGPTGEMDEYERARWNDIVRELDAGIKSAADMDRNERQKLNARMNAVNNHLGIVEVQVAHQEVIEKAAEEAAAIQEASAKRAAGDEKAEIAELAKVEAAGAKEETEAAEVKNEMITAVESNAGVDATGKGGPTEGGDGEEGEFKAGSIHGHGLLSILVLGVTALSFAAA